MDDVEKCDQCVEGPHVLSMYAVNCCPEHGPMCEEHWHDHLHATICQAAWAMLAEDMD